MLEKSFDKIVKEKLNGIEVEPPAYVWNAINQHMLAEKRRRRVLFYWQSAAAVALVVLSVGIIFFMSDRNVRKKQLAKVENPVTVKGEQPVIEKQKAYVEKNALTPVNTASATIKETESFDTEKITRQSSIGTERQAIGIVTKKSDTSANHPVVNLASETTKEVYLAKMDYLSVSEIEVAVPDVRLVLPEKSISKRPTLYAYNTVMPVYKPKYRKFKFIVGGSASPAYNYRNVSESQYSSVVHNVYDSSTSESGVVSVSGGVNMRVEDKSRWSFETGVLYSQVGQEVSQTTNHNSISGISGYAMASSDNFKRNSLISTNKFNNTMGPIRYNNNTSMGIEQNLHKSGVYLESSVNTFSSQSESTTLKQLLDYIEVPLMVRYSVLNKKPVITLAGGFSTNFLVDNNVYLVENGEYVNAGETEGISGVTYSSTLGLGMELPLGKSIRFSLEPRFKYYLSPVNSKGYNSFRPYSFGIWGGVSFMLNSY